MIWAIILTFVITVLLMSVLFLRKTNEKQGDELRFLQKENDKLNCQISDCYNQNNRRREQAAYNRGLYDGRETDTLYRNIVKKYQDGDQVTVMMRGEPRNE